MLMISLSSCQHLRVRLGWFSCWQNFVPRVVLTLRNSRGTTERFWLQYLLPRQRIHLWWASGWQGPWDTMAHEIWRLRVQSCKSWDWLVDNLIRIWSTEPACPQSKSCKICGERKGRGTNHLMEKSSRNGSSGGTSFPSKPMWKIQRCYFTGADHKKVTLQFHHFCDASEVGYGTSIYLVIVYPDGTVECGFVLGNFRNAPIKTDSIPRLELQDALLGARVNRSLRRKLTSNSKEWLSRLIRLSPWTTFTMRIADFRPM